MVLRPQAALRDQPQRPDHGAEDHLRQHRRQHRAGRDDPPSCGQALRRQGLHRPRTVPQALAAWPTPHHQHPAQHEEPSDASGRQGHAAQTLRHRDRARYPEIRNGARTFTPQVGHQRHGPCPVLPRRLRVQTRQALHFTDSTKNHGLSIAGVNYPEIFARSQETPGCFIHAPDPRSTHEVTPEEREAFWEKLYAEPGFGIWQGNFRDVLVDREANRLLSDFIARKIRQRVKDPAVAEKLIPKNHGFGTRRVPLETHYYEVYNRPSVKLIDINETPIERITPNGIKTSDAEYDFDIIIYATGFDAITGAFDRIDIRGVDGARLKDLWKDGPQTYLGVLVEGFPNMLMVMGPHAGLGNFPRAAEYSVEWVTGLLGFVHERGLSQVEATAAGVSEWTEHVLSLGEGLLMNEIDSWMTGVNRNVEGKQTRKIMRYSGGHPAFREHCDAVAADGYRRLARA